MAACLLSFQGLQGHFQDMTSSLLISLLLTQHRSAVGHKVPGAEKIILVASCVQLYILCQKGTMVLQKRIGDPAVIFINVYTLLPIALQPLNVLGLIPSTV
jgi:hypothetical protein